MITFCFLSVGLNALPSDISCLYPVLEPVLIVNIFPDLVYEESIVQIYLALDCYIYDGSVATIYVMVMRIYKYVYM